VTRFGLIFSNAVCLVVTVHFEDYKFNGPDIFSIVVAFCVMVQSLCNNMNEKLKNITFFSNVSYFHVVEPSRSAETVKRLLYIQKVSCSNFLIKNVFIHASKQIPTYH
jgi:hypothetical protein